MKAILIKDSDDCAYNLLFVFDDEKYDSALKIVVNYEKYLKTVKETFEVDSDEEDDMWIETCSWLQKLTGKEIIGVTDEDCADYIITR